MKTSESSLPTFVTLIGVAMIVALGVWLTPKFWHHKTDTAPSVAPMEVPLPKPTKDTSWKDNIIIYGPNNQPIKFQEAPPPKHDPKVLWIRA